MESDEVSPVAGRFVWEKWRHVWYMGRIVDELTGSAVAIPGKRGSGDSLSPSASSTARNTASHSHEMVKVHIHGEPDTNDKWFPMTSANLELLTVIPSEMTAIGAFPALNEHVELLLMDQKLYDVALLSCEQNEEDRGTTGHQQQLTLVGRVAQVLPAHDASVVDVEYPSAYRHVVRERRVHIGNGYLKVISEDEFQDRQRRLEQAVARAFATESTSTT